MIFKQLPLYRFLMICESTGLDKVVLDCGAGGATPPLSLFKSYGFETYGVECRVDQLEQANEFAYENNQTLNIKLGDMRQLAFKEASISFLYAYNSMHHLRKDDIEISINEMKRVLKKDGIMFVNFVSVDDFRFNQAQNLQFEQREGVKVMGSYFKKNEAEKYFSDMQFLYKETRIVESILKGKWVKQVFMDYILRKI